MNSFITVKAVIDELDGTYLDDEKADIYPISAKLRQVERAVQNIMLKVSEQAPSILMRSIVIPYSQNQQEYPLLPREIAGGTTNLSTTVTSNGAFLPGDVGTSIAGTGIPAGTTVATFVDTSTITISQAATGTGSPTLTLYGLARDFLRGYQAKYRTSQNPQIETRLTNIKYSELAAGREGWYIRDGFFGIYCFLQIPGTVILDYIRRLVPPLSTESTLPFDDEWTGLIALGAGIRLRAPKLFSDGAAASLQAMKEQYNEDLKLLCGSYAKRATDKVNDIASI
jgi:hypothetical protein